jgi:hypothetical protein
MQRASVEGLQDVQPITIRRDTTLDLALRQKLITFASNGCSRFRL